MYSSELIKCIIAGGGGGKEKSWIKFGKVSACQISKHFFNSKSFAPPPLWERVRYFHTPLPPFYSRQYRQSSFSPLSRWGNGLRAAPGHAWVTSGDAESVTNCSGIQARPPATPLSPNATQIVSEKPQFSMSMSSLLTPNCGNVSLVLCLNSTCWYPPQLDFGGWVITFTDKAKRKRIFEVPLTFFGHPHFKALLEPTVLASIPGDFINNTILISVTSVNHVLLNTSAEKALRASEKKRKLSKTTELQEKSKSTLSMHWLLALSNEVMAAEKLTYLSLKILVSLWNMIVIFRVSPFAAKQKVSFNQNWTWLLLSC